MSQKVIVLFSHTLTSEIYILTKLNEFKMTQNGFFGT